MADTAAALVIQLTAETRDFQKEMRKATGVFDAEGRKIERSQKRLRDNIQKNFAGVGTTLAGVLSAGAVIGFARNILNTADALSDASQQLGVTVQQLQGLDYAARVSGASSEKLTQALGFLSDGLGDAQKGEGDLAKYMRANGVQMGDTIDVLYDLANRTKAASTYQEKMNIATSAFGAKAGKSMVSFLNQGAEGLRRLQEEASAKGQIWDEGTLRNLDSAKDSFETLQKAFVNLAAVPSSVFLDDMSGFLNALSQNDWRTGIDKLARLMPVIAGVLVGGRVGGFAGAAVGGLAGLAIENFLPQDKTAPATGAKGPEKQIRRGVPLSAADAAKAAAAAAKALQDAQRVNEILRSAAEDARKAGDDANETLRDVVREQDQSLLSRAQDWSNFSDIQKEVIEELAKLDISSIEDRRDAELRALELRRKADQDDLDDHHASIDQKIKLDQDYADQRVAVEQDAANKIKVVRTKEAGDISAIQTNSIKVSDRMRQSLIDIGIAGLHGFDSLKDAAARALEQIAEMILELYILKPLVESIFGAPGTDIFSSMFGFAKGGVMTPGGPRQLQRFASGGLSNKAAIFGEAGPEAAVPLPDGRRIPVELRMPRLPDISRSSGQAPVIVQNFDLSGAVMTDELMDRIDRRADASAQRHLAKYDRNVLPQRVAILANDPRRRY